MDKENILKIQTLDMQMKQLEQTINQLEEQIQEITTTLNQMDDLKEAQEDDELLVSVVNGVFAKAKLSDMKELFVNVGNNIVVPKTIDNIKKLMQSQQGELSMYRDQLVLEFQKLVSEAQELDKKISPG